MELVFDICSYKRVELIEVPKLVRVVCDTWVLESPPIVFGHVPLLCDISLIWPVMSGQPPFLLSNWLSSVRSLSTLTLNFDGWEVWIKPEDPKRLSHIFNKLTDLYLRDIFAEYNLEWTLYLLEATPSLENSFLKIQRHNFDIYKGMNPTNLQWQASSYFKHHSLNLLDIEGFEVDCKLMRYIRRVMERAVWLKMIRLQHEEPCDDCDAQKGRLGYNFPGNEIDEDLIREILTHGFSSAIEIVIVGFNGLCSKIRD